MRIVFTPMAMRHVADLHGWIASRASESVADRYVERILASCRSFELFPLRGTRRDDILPGLRTIGFERRITIAFMVTENEIVIEGVFYGGQDFEAALRGPE